MNFLKRRWVQIAIGAVVLYAAWTYLLAPMWATKAPIAATVDKTSSSTTPPSGSGSTTTSPTTPVRHFRYSGPVYTAR